MDLLLGTLMMWVFGSPLYLPWIFARLGKYKRWYLAYFAPPVMWGKVIYAWPASAGFIVTPLIVLIPNHGDLRLLVWGIIGTVGVILGFLMVLWQPKWAKPDWQRYLEDKYAWREIRGVFIPHWRQMDRQTWNRLMDSEEGIDELVRMAREKTYGYP